ncbi:hypothetical protein HRbin33_02626 [bacterium HR33]|nr:hypothetical protein HRbin33_02626 [bacterium HR33]
MAKRYGSGTVYRQGRIWWVQYYVNGRRYRESSKSAHKADAVRLLRQRLAAADAGNLVVNADRVRFEDLREWLGQDYAAKSRKSWKRANEALDILARRLGNRKAIEITAPLLARYVEERRQEVALATVAYELAVLKRAFSVATERGYLATRPVFPKLRVENARDEFIEDDEFYRIREALPDYPQGMVTFAWWTGWRVRSEVLPLRWSEVDFQTGTVRLRVGTTKNKEGRVFPFAALPELRETLERQRAYTDRVERVTGAIVPLVFHRFGRPIRNPYKAWRRACIEAGAIGRDGLPKKLHDFRRSAVRRLERAGISRSLAMQLVGHKTEAIYRRCAVTREADLAEAVAKMGALVPETVLKQPYFRVIGD